MAKVREIFRRGPDRLLRRGDLPALGGQVATSVVTRNYTARGRLLDVNYKGRLLPGHEADWAAYLICVEDVSGAAAGLAPAGRPHARTTR